MSFHILAVSVQEWKSAILFGFVFVFSECSERGGVVNKSINTSTRTRILATTCIMHDNEFIEKEASLSLFTETKKK